LSNSAKGYAYVIISAFLTGTIFTLGKSALVSVSPEFLITWIFLIAAVLLGIWSFTSGEWRGILRCKWRDWINIIAFSSFSIVALQTLWMGIQHLDPTVAAFLSRLQTLVAVFLGVVFLRERFGRWEAIGGLVMIIGVLIIKISFDVTLNVWFWVTIASGVFFGVTEVFAKQAVGGLHPIPLNFVRNSIIAIFYVFLMMGKGDPLFEFKGTFWCLLLMGAIGPNLSRLSFLYALRYLDVSKATLLNQMQPLFVSLTAFTLLGMIPSLREWIGGILILAGCVALMAGKVK